MIITPCPYLMGYEISEYRDFICCDDTICVDRGGTGIYAVSKLEDKVGSSLHCIRINVLAELKEKAYELGCNAVIGVNFNYVTLDPETANSDGGTTCLPYIFNVTVNGTAVVAEKIKKQKDCEPTGIPEDIPEEISEEFVPDL